MTKQEALQALSSVHAYALETHNPSHPFARDMATWLQRQFGSDGVTETQKNARARTAQSKQASKETGGKSGLAVFQHPKKSDAAPSRPKLAVAEKKPSRLEQPETAQPEAEVAAPSNTENKKVAAAEPLDDVDLNDLKDLKPRVIANRYKASRIEATLKERFGIIDEDIPGGEMQKAAMLKARANA